MSRPTVVFMGTPDFAVASLAAICDAGYEVKAVVTVPDRQAGRGMKLTPSPVKEYAVEHSLPVLQPEKLRDPEFLERLKSYNADLFVVVAFRMLPQVVWQMPPMGTFNLHASLLPDYRGAAPINWAVMNGEKETGVTTFFLNEKIDEGKILLQEKTPIYDDDTAGTLHDRLMEIGKHLVVNTIRGLENNSIEPQPQKRLNPKDAPKIFKDDCRIDWNRSGEEIVNFVRGLSPYPAAFMNLEYPDGGTVSFKVFDAAFEKEDGVQLFYLKTDGKKYLKIGVKDGFIAINEIQMSGKRKNTIEDFLRGNNITDCKLVF